MKKAIATQWGDSSTFDLYDESGMMIEPDFESLEDVISYCSENDIELDIF